MRLIALPIALTAAAALTLGAVQASASSETDGSDDTGHERSTEAVLLTAEGEEVGLATFTAVPGGTLVAVTGAAMPEGFHGFHVHQTGLCEPDSEDPASPGTFGDFLSAGGHLGVGESDHGSHTGDLTSLYVTEAGDAALTTLTEQFTPEGLLDEDGSALMVHVGPDNFANVPERYAPDGPDETTRNTGDSGGRFACGVVRS